MLKFKITPTEEGYKFTDGQEVLSIELDGGLPRTRRNILNASAVVSVTWVTDEEGYKYIRAFYRTGVKNGSESFLIDLLLNNLSLTEVVAKFVPNSISLDSVKGLSRTVSATLSIVQDKANETNDLDFINNYGT